MKNKKIRMVLFSIVLSAGQILPGMAGAQGQAQQELQEVMRDINRKNEQLNAPQESTKKYRYNFINKKPKLTKEDNALMWKDYKKKKVKERISVSSAKKEIKWLFRLLRSQYGMYVYYGGDTAFGKAEKEILKAVGDGNGGKGTIKTEKYQSLLHRFLNFINDSHLAIGEQLFVQEVRLFSDESVHYIKNGASFYREGKQEDAIVKINGKKPEIYLKRAIDENGFLTYYPYDMLKQKKNSVTYDVEYQSGKTGKIMLKPAEYSYKKTVKRMYGYDQYDSLAYVEMNVAYMDWEFPKERKAFLKDVPKMKKQDRLVFDLRNNTGGDGTLIDEWFQAYTGEKLQPNYSTLRIRPIWINNAKEIRKEDRYWKKYGMKKSEKYYYTDYPKYQYLKNDGKQIFVLTSRHTCSAAEAMTDALRNLENVVVIGTNTGGVLINQATYQMAMPYSGLFLQFGECLENFDSSYFRESYGMEPDIYLTGGNLKKRLKKFFGNYVEV